MIKFACSNCSKSIRVDDKYAGKKGKCPKCGSALVVPERSTLIEFHCDGCGAKIKVPERHAGKKGKCPKCQAPIVVPALAEAPVEPEIAPEPEAPIAPEIPPEPDLFDEPAADEELYEEPAPAPRPAAGLDRRLVIALIGVVVVAIVATIGLVIFLRSGASEPTVAPSPRRQTAGTEAPPAPAPAEETTVEEAPVESPVTPVANGAATLQFAPRPGEKQTRRVTTRAAISAEQMGQQQEVVSTQSLTVDLEAREANPDGTIPVRVTLAQIQVKTEIGGVLQGEYDSAKPDSEGALMARFYVPFVGKRFTIGVSRQGEIIDSGLDELFLAAAVDLMETEDDMMREQLKDRAAAAIEKQDQRLGSRRERTMGLKKQLEAFPFINREKVRSVLDHLIAALPAEPVQSGAAWSGAVSVRGTVPLDMLGTYTVTALDEASCTIEAQAERSADEEPVIQQMTNMTISHKLAGSSQVQLVIDRQTGWLRRKEQKTTLAGKTLMVPATGQGPQAATEVAMEITTTVSPVE